MRLWHEALIPILPRQQLLGQHRECCALRGNGWGKKHETVNYVFLYSPYKLVQYHQLIMQEMINRGYNLDKRWQNRLYRGKIAHPYDKLEKLPMTEPIYPEHDDQYKQECLNNLANKGIYL